MKRKVFYSDYDGDDRVYYGGEWMSSADASEYEAQHLAAKSTYENWFDLLPEDERDAIANEGEDHG